MGEPRCIPLVNLISRQPGAECRLSTPSLCTGTLSPASCYASEPIRILCFDSQPLKPTMACPLSLFWHKSMQLFSTTPLSLASVLEYLRFRLEDSVKFVIKACLHLKCCSTTPSPGQGLLYSSRIFAIP